MTYTPTPNDKALAKLRREYPAFNWSCTVLDETQYGVGDGLDVTFQRYSDDAEDRYVIRDGHATLLG
jgi:hypothetical protein